MPKTTAERVEAWRGRQIAKGRCIICGERASKRGGVVRRKCLYHLDMANENRRKKTKAAKRSTRRRR